MLTDPHVIKLVNSKPWFLRTKSFAWRAKTAISRHELKKMLTTFNLPYMIMNSFQNFCKRNKVGRQPTA